ncbi:transposase [Fusibacter sp. Q10-2]|uniref:Transposase n=2 Tax=Fusibacter ferrireducens TaxID=2785058 RepID=A0ABR9ZXX2_9FIRM|nr:transposase [Fusibacter ferrireducens]
MGIKPSVEPVNLLKIILFCYSEGIMTSRKIEAFCKYDTRAFFTLEGSKVPDYTTINRFRKIWRSSRPIY